MQYAYLLFQGKSIHQGSVPFVDFYTSVYTPVFAWTILPIIKLVGFTLSAAKALRAFMIFVFLLRVTATSIVISKLFGKKVLLFFLPLFFLDPFTVFAAMQIRPDNLMTLFFSFALLSLIFAQEKKSGTLLFSTGIFLGLSLVTLLKILPAALCLIFFCGMYLYKNKSSIKFIFLLSGTLVPVICLAFYGIANGSLFPMIQQVIFDSVKAFGAFQYPVPFGNFYWYNNLYIFGAPGKPASWIFAWILLFLACMGAYELGKTLLSKKTLEPKDYIKSSVVCTLVVTQISFFFINNLYIQYYIPISWLYALMGAIALHDLVATSQKKLMTLTFFAIVITTFMIRSIPLNISRSTIEDRERIAVYVRRLEKIPIEEKVFPAFLFRPLAFPMLYGYFMTPSEATGAFLSHYAPIEQYLERDKVKFVILNDYTMTLIPQSTQAYIKSHYRRSDPDDEELFIRK